LIAAVQKRADRNGGARIPDCSLSRNEAI